MYAPREDAASRASSCQLLTESYPGRSGSRRPAAWRVAPRVSPGCATPARARR